ncbi:hypothetical protein BN8_01377 [Fibrisoma limi BUZ 3]|uniref:Uncharacterized protein n=1 Tax=Fibrisoma limi BUZ 3 TaxID=1185876 RepID=I2GEQ3_9BACT|nr:hypothetical protein [Fibrisoma limi]CCH52378.1 hypothetical protein BN8_01377 [Fibrisoma limi BUZ 3]
MNQASKNLSDLLETYLLTVASQTIDSATPKQQADFIHLILQVGNDSSFLRPMEDADCQMSYDEESRKLRQDRRWLLEKVQGILDRNQAYMEYLQQAICQCEHYNQQRLAIWLTESARVRMETLNHRLSKSYQQLLTKRQAYHRALELGMKQLLVE